MFTPIQFPNRIETQNLRFSSKGSTHLSTLIFKIRKDCLKIAHVMSHVKMVMLTFNANPGVTSQVILPPMSMDTLGVDDLSSMQDAIHVNSLQWMHFVGVSPPNAPSVTKTRQSLRQESLKLTPRSDKEARGRNVNGVLWLSFIHWCFLENIICNI